MYKPTLADAYQAIIKCTNSKRQVRCAGQSVTFHLHSAAYLLHQCTLTHKLMRNIHMLLRSIDSQPSV